eukprot:6186739-Pleurochrysis_carterae.AAC.4
MSSERASGCLRAQLHVQTSRMVSLGMRWPKSEPLPGWHYEELLRFDDCGPLHTIARLLWLICADEEKRGRIGREGRTRALIAKRGARRQRRDADERTELFRDTTKRTVGVQKKVDAPSYAHAESTRMHARRTHK